MTKAEFTQVSRILTNELFISSEELDAWKIVGKCDQDDVIRFLEQYRTGRQMGLRMVPDPKECKEACEKWHGYDPHWWAAVQAVKEESNGQDQSDHQTAI